MMLLTTFLFVLASSESFYQQPVYAKAAYSTPQQILTWTCPMCLQYPYMKLADVSVFSKNGFQGFAGYDTNYDALTVAFRGNSTAQQFFADLNFTQADYPYCQGCKVNARMFKAWTDLQADTLNAFKKLIALYRGAKFFVAYGHGIGGAIASLAARDIQEIYQFSEECYIYTQGKPRIGNKLFSDSISNVLSIKNVVHWQDKVPHLPPQELGYFRQGEEYWCNEYMADCRECQVEATQCSNSLTDYTFDDHPIDGYFYPEC